MTWLFVSLAGGVGAATRFLVDSWIARHHRLNTPMGTIVINVTACFILGLATGLGLDHTMTASWTSVIGTGFCGGYSTFSTASVEGARLFLSGRARAGLLHAGGMLVLGTAAAALGMLLG
ncbi:fluoride efflux transporter FluC [Acidipropionibacterium acidipropionici]|jgi:CrcB protein|uniref:fluoride efflux transporter FluC n=1 Tax=Acidipropionibacterium acidipropionici TaxID=1748 RepID=UPI00110A1019|nr:CrcB family protein [Acidipropionibacterium acidipropionici]QCV95945.1 CrcB family protein [Acidipropionibacterium acidipropionici]